ncbi:nitroreductase family protein [Planococcus sp. N028]|uniref:Nitroreductase family protein n=1 Tax=Planococcus shixiaomingii TaxID=3058393 RepID=A0ABT8N4F8_9BACL|nr:nitroreductase family protein [Planococcus sp. N028]MDN7242762.1 nitroreductase family protein [Planococcus sp. N028]
MTKDFYSAVEARRSVYQIGNEPVISDERLQEIINHAVMNAPSAFNSQSSRVVVLLGDNHKKLWDITKETLRKITEPDKFSSTEAKMNAFGSGYGTLLIFEDDAVIEALQKQYASYKDAFPLFSYQSSGMLQYVLWTALEHEGYGATLQHYNPLIDEEIKAEWNLPDSWKLLAQMPFGKPLSEPAEKQQQPIEERVLIVK